MRLPLSLLLVLPLLAVSGTSAAQTTIHRCTGAGGTPVFTDQPCTRLGATPVTGNPSSPHPPRGPKHCPMTLDALRQRVAAAFRSRDANALAGLMLWHGYGERGAADTVRQLAQLMQWPFLGFAHANQMGESASTALLTLKLDDPARPLVSLRIVHRDACLWLAPPARHPM